MVVQFFKGGRTFTGAKNAVAYLLNDRVEKKQAKVFAGNSYLTLETIKSIDRKWKFTSGVISFEESYEQVKNILPEIQEEFEKTFFAGLNKDQYNILYVLHTDKSRAELHFLIPRVELTTGKDLAIYTHKKDLVKKDLFQQYINFKYNLTNPLDKSKKRTLEVSTKWSNDNKELKKQIHNYVEKAVTKGFISNRDDVIKLLTDAGFRVKESKNYLSIKTDDMNRAVRLKGVFYNEGFRSIAKLGSEYRTAGTTDNRNLQEEIRRIKQRLDERIEKDITANRERYKATKRNGVGKHRLGTRATKNTNKIDLAGDRNINRNNIYSRNNISINGDNKNELGERLYKQGMVSKMGQTDTDRNRREEIDDSTRATIIRRIRAKREARIRAFKQAKQAREAVYRQNRAERSRIFEENRRARESLYRKLKENCERQQAELRTATAAAEQLNREAERDRIAVTEVAELRQQTAGRFIEAVRSFTAGAKNYLEKVGRGIDIFLRIRKIWGKPVKQKKKQKVRKPQRMRMTL